MQIKTIYILFLAFAVAGCGDISKEFNERYQESHNNDSLSIEEGGNSEVSAELRWMEKISGVDWVDNSAPDHILKFGKPSIHGGSIKGELEEHFPGLVNSGLYESTSEGVLKIRLLKTINAGVEEQRSSTADLKLNLTEENTLVIHYQDGRILSYKRAQNNHSKKETITGNGSGRLWMDKIQGDWKSIRNHEKVIFNNPVQQGDIIKGEVEMHEESFIQVFSYEKTADGQMKCKMLRYKITGDKDYTENDSGKEYDISFKTELLDEGNTLILYNSNGTSYTYKH